MTSLPDVRGLSALRGAVSYSALGFEPIALHGLRRVDGELVCTCGAGGRCEAKKRGKHPTRTGWTTDEITEELLRERFAGIDPRNVGLRTGGALRLVVLDVDGAEGLASLKALEAEHSVLPSTAIARTGSGGIHVLFLCPANLDLGAIPNAVKFRPGLDVRAQGGQIVVEPSTHYSGNRYEWIERGPIAELPAWLHAVMVAGAPSRATIKNETPGGTTAPPGAAVSPADRPPVRTDRRTIASARAWLRKKPGAVSGEAGDKATFRGALAIVRGFNLGDDDAIDLLAEWNAACVPPWDRADLARKVALARTTTDVRAPAWGSLVTRERPAPARDASGRLVSADGEVLEDGPGGAAAPEEEANVRDETDHQGDDAEQLRDERPEASAPPAEERRQDAPRRTTTERRAAPPLDPWRYHTTDTGNGERLVARHGQAIRYCHPWQKWLVWTGKRWVVDAKGTVRRRAKETALSIYAEASAVQAKVPGEEESEKQAGERRKQLAAWAVKSEARDRRAAMVDLAQSEEGIPVIPEELDADPWLLNVANGTLDLHTGELRPHRREDLLTKLAPVAYDPAATCPQWSAFLVEIMAGDLELVTFLQRFIGYALTGVIREHVLVSLFGSGSNGKSTFLELVFALLGDYAWKAPSDLLLAKKHDAHPTDKASLFGVRFAACVETAEGRALDEPKVKELTGGDTISARRMREDFWIFTPTHKLALASNHRPVIKGTDHGTWRRQKLVPFLVTIPDERQDKRLAEKLRGELAGILRWAVEGCLAWQRDGLGEPSAVRVATQEWKDESDPIAQFLAECCVIEPQTAARAEDLYAAYVAFVTASGTGEKPLTQTAFGKRLTERGMVSSKSTHGARIRRGLRLLTPMERRAQEDGTTDWTIAPS